MCVEAWVGPRFGRRVGEVRFQCFPRLSVQVEAVSFQCFPGLGIRVDVVGSVTAQPGSG